MLQATTTLKAVEKKRKDYKELQSGWNTVQIKDHHIIYLYRPVKYIAYDILATLQSSSLQELYIYTYIYHFSSLLFQSPSSGGSLKMTKK